MKSKSIIEKMKSKQKSMMEYLKNFKPIVQNKVEEKKKEETFEDKLNEITAPLSINNEASRDDEKSEEDKAMDLLKNAGKQNDINKENSSNSKANADSVLNKTVKNLTENSVNDEKNAENGENSAKNGEKLENVSENKPVVTNMPELIDALSSTLEKYENLTDFDFYKDKLADAPDKLGLEKKEKIEIDNDKIARDAETEANNNTEIEKLRLKNQYNDKTEALEKSKDVVKENANTEVDNINKIMDQQRIAAENDALKRGLARSSIIIKSLDGIEESRASELIGVSKSISSKIESISSEIAALSNDLNTELEALELSKAVKTLEIATAKYNELKKAQDEALEFNNNIEKLEAEYQLKYQDYLKKYEEQKDVLAEKYKNIATDKKNEEMINIAKDYFNTMDKKTALDTIINSVELKELLGDDLVTLYYSQMNRK